jgi:hypothetical protein
LYRFIVIGYETEDNTQFQDKFQILKINFSLAAEELFIVLVTLSIEVSESTKKVFTHSPAEIEDEPKP